MKQHIILALGWIVFSFLHSLLAALSFKEFMIKILGSRFRYYRLFYTLFAACSFFAVIFYQLTIKSLYLFEPNFFTKLAGALVLMTGLIIMGICIKKYFWRLSGLKTLFIDEKTTGNVLSITGIHRYLRHPLYAGTFLFIWGLFILIPLSSLLISNFIITIYTLIGIRYEEDKLIKEFGEQYKAYQKKVPMILPTFKPSPAD